MVRFSFLSNDFFADAFRPKIHRTNPTTTISIAPSIELIAYPRIIARLIHWTTLHSILEFIFILSSTYDGNYHANSKINYLA